MVYSRNKKNTKIVTDSGGFQVMTNKLFPWHDHRELNGVRKAVLDWQMETGDIGMIIDVPAECVRGCGHA